MKDILRAKRNNGFIQYVSDGLLGAKLRCLHNSGRECGGWSKVGAQVGGAGWVYSDKWPWHRMLLAETEEKMWRFR